MVGEGIYSGELRTGPCLVAGELKTASANGWDETICARAEKCEQAQNPDWFNRRCSEGNSRYLDCPYGEKKK